MNLLASLCAKDVDASALAADYSGYKLRRAGRVVIFDGQKVALLHVRKHAYYMLPGGGIENEDMETALRREALEELGCLVVIDREIGSTQIFLDRWHSRQVDTCFIAHKVGVTTAHTPTDFELEEGHEIVWATSLPAATQLLERATPANLDAKLIRARDLLFLQTAHKILS